MDSQAQNAAVAQNNEAGFAPQEPESRAHLKRPRNKLPYYRTSIACRYCRSRKTRCILGPSKQKGKCKNCEHLGRDCVFLTVNKDLTGQRKQAGSDQSTRDKLDSPYEGTHDVDNPTTELQGAPFNASRSSATTPAYHAVCQPWEQSLSPFAGLTKLQNLEIAQQLYDDSWFLYGLDQSQTDQRTWHIPLNSTF